jgi:C_GCAxxG_C_C family probable redox protein
MNGGIEMSRSGNATNTFIQGYNCTQAVLSSFGEEFGLDRITAYKVASAFGGGMGHMGHTCGSVTGAFMVIGLKYGLTVADGSQSHWEAFSAVREFVEEFRKRNGSIVCNELLGFNIDDRARFREAMKQGIPQKICPKLVRDAVEITEGLLQ